MLTYLNDKVMIHLTWETDSENGWIGIEGTADNDQQYNISMEIDMDDEAEELMMKELYDIYDSFFSDTAGFVEREDGAFQGLDDPLLKANFDMNEVKDLITDLDDLIEDFSDVEI